MKTKQTTKSTNNSDNTQTNANTIKGTHNNDNKNTTTNITSTNNNSNCDIYLDLDTDVHYCGLLLDQIYIIQEKVLQDMDVKMSILESVYQHFTTQIQPRQTQTQTQTQQHNSGSNNDSINMSVYTMVALITAWQYRINFVKEKEIMSDIYYS